MPPVVRHTVVRHMVVRHTWAEPNTLSGVRERGDSRSSTARASPETLSTGKETGAHGAGSAPTRRQHSETQACSQVLPRGTLSPPAAHPSCSSKGQGAAELLEGWVYTELPRKINSLH